MWEKLCDLSDNARVFTSQRKGYFDTVNLVSVEFHQKAKGFMLSCPAWTSARSFVLMSNK